MPPRQRRNDLGVTKRCLRVIDRGLVGVDERFLLATTARWVSACCFDPALDAASCW